MFSQAVALYESVRSRRRLRRDVDVEANIDGWCAAELAPWPVQLPGEGAALLALNRVNPSVYLYVINNYGVRLVAKPPSSQAVGPVLEGRAQLYLAALTRVVRRIAVQREIMLAIDVNDAPAEADTVPVFSFQKQSGSRNILLPDVDFFHSVQNALPNWLNTDWRRWSRKQHRAIFAGSTSGGVITAESLRQDPVPRVRAALAFQDEPAVEFRLSRFTGDETPEAAAILRALGHGQGTVSWQTQLGYRFIISIDGNGATCSRVPIVLRSHSVLLKYDSPHLLYYFHGLQPGVHYVPITADEDVVGVIEDARVNPARYRAIARAGRIFRRRYLTQFMVDYYLERLVWLYQRRPVAVAPPGEAAPIADLVAAE